MKLLAFAKGIKSCIQSSKKKKEMYGKFIDGKRYSSEKFRNSEISLCFMFVSLGDEYSKVCG
jgi:hypothetical protein